VIAGQRREDVGQARHHLGSPVRTARRSALDTTFSMTVIGMRCETPERLSIALVGARLERHALDDLGHQLGDAHGRAPSPRPPAARPRLLRVIAIPSSTLSG
jgi:hypothetical protein